MEILHFRPILKQTIWGGNKIKAYKNLVSDATQVGESWEVSGVQGSETVCSDVPGAVTLNQLVAQYGEQLVGKKNYLRFGNEFPLLIKFIDARQDLSVQVHPDDEVARRHGLKHGKTEMWYLLKSDSRAMLSVGLKHSITPEEYKVMVANDTFESALSRYAVSEGDVFFLPAGRVHAIGAGCFLAEIQQTSDVTYRIYDYGRHDKDGNLRQLHTHKAAESIDYSVMSDYRTHYTPHRNQAVELVSSSCFTTSLYDIDRPVAVEAASLDGFVILIGLKGEGTVTTEHEESPLWAGQTVLIAAENKKIAVSGSIRFLEVHID